MFFSQQEVGRDPSGKHTQIMQAMTAFKWSLV